MKTRYKIAAVFTLLTTTVVATLCILIYLLSAEQYKRDFNKRLHNRALTVASLLSRFPENGYQIQSKLDSSTANLLVSETIQVYDASNKIIYEFIKNTNDRIQVEHSILDDARLNGFASHSLDQRLLVAIDHKNVMGDIVIVSSAIDVNSRENLGELRRSLVIAFLTGLFISFLTGWFFSKQLLNPIKKITATVKNISANNIEMRLTEPIINDEWKELAVTFNELLQRLQDSFEIQGRFISNASHEMSTPLTIISNQIDVTLQKERSKEEYFSVLQSVQGDVAHMSALTQQLLNLARTARGGALLTEPVRADEIIMELPAMLKKISKAYNVRILFDELPEEENLSTVNGNYELLSSALKNLAENACKYSSDHTVNISLSFVDTRIILLFSNNVDYFNTDELETIFQPFQRGTNIGNAKGNGLGLSLTRRIILLHKGEIKAEIVDGKQLLISVILPSS